jgi:CRP-like cAMP-binding protein
MLIADVFLGIAEPSLAEVLRRAQFLDVPEGDMIVEQGDLSDSMYIIESGSVDIRERLSGSRQEALLATLHKGQFFGEMGTLAGGRRSASAYARSRASLIRLDRETLEFIAGYHVSFASGAQSEGASAEAEWEAAWTKVIRSSCHTIAAAHGAIQSIDLALKPIRSGGPMHLVYGVQVHGKVTEGHSIVRLSASPLE